MAVILGVALVMIPIRHGVMGQVTMVSFAAMVLIITVFYNGVFLLVFHKTDEFAYLWNIVAKKITGLRE
mgnify:FL=1